MDEGKECKFVLVRGGHGDAAFAAGAAGPAREPPRACWRWRSVAAAMDFGAVDPFGTESNFEKVFILGRKKKLGVAL